MYRDKTSLFVPKPRHMPSMPCHAIHHIVYTANKRALMKVKHTDRLGIEPFPSYGIHLSTSPNKKTKAPLPACPCIHHNYRFPVIHLFHFTSSSSKNPFTASLEVLVK